MSLWMFLGMQLTVALLVALLVWKGGDLEQRLRGRNK